MIRKMLISNQIKTDKTILCFSEISARASAVTINKNVRRPQTSATDNSSVALPTQNWSLIRVCAENFNVIPRAKLDFPARVKEALPLILQ